VLLHSIEVDARGLRAELRIGAPVDAIAGYVGDLRNLKTWWPEHPVYRRLRGDGGVGSLYAWVYLARGVPVAGLSRVLVREQPARFEYRAGPPVLGVRFAYRFTADGDATRVDFSCLTPLARLQGFRDHFVPEVTRALDRLAEQLDRGRGHPRA